MTALRFASVCSGIGAPEVAWASLGWAPAWCSEIDPFACAVLAQRHPGVPNLGDMTAIEPEAALHDHGRIDMLVGGTPCQSFSLAGRRAGLDDPRGQLSVWFAELAHGLGPRWLVWENVPGVLSSDQGESFAFVLSCLSCGWVEAPAGGWRDAGCVEAPPDGYGLAWRVLDAQYAGLAQRRKRVFVVGCLGDWRRAAAVLLERHGLRGGAPPGRPAGSCVAGALTRSLGSGGADDNKARANWYVPDVAHTLVGEGHDAIGDGTGRGAPLVVMHGPVVRRLTPREQERLQGFPDDYTLVRYRGKLAKDAPRQRAIGNSMAVPVVQWIGHRIAAVEEIT